MEHKISLSWLDRKTSPNSRGHYMTIHGARKKRKCDAWALCCGLPKPKTDENIPITIIFNPPTAQRFDLDNALASLKGDIDGIAARLGVDDRQFRPITLDVGSIGKPGSVEITLTYGD